MYYSMTIAWLICFSFPAAFLPVNKRKETFFTSYVVLFFFHRFQENRFKQFHAFTLLESLDGI